MVLNLSSDAPSVSHVHTHINTGKCSGKVKSINVLDIPTSCVEIYDSPALYANITECTGEDVAVSLFKTSACKVPLKTEKIPDGQCFEATVPGQNLTIALSPECSVAKF